MIYCRKANREIKKTTREKKVVNLAEVDDRDWIVHPKIKLSGDS